MTDRSADSASPAPTLYQRLGGEPVIERLIGEFYRRVLADEILSPFFAHTPMARLEAMQREFFAAALGGPARYTGRPLSEAHAGRGIRRQHVQRFLDHLFAALESLGESDPARRLSEEDRLEIISHINTYVGEITGEGSMAG
ncbi:MAG: group 1 truncated hemoglobin [Acidobacteria bacterium]|nr:MAG: group 1 truncated hemoglobin [Acidobacteriota bacterium]REK10615.1 MAG: group 1 truncated hemoglobin [Acidobacteriota bacterium]